MAEHGLTPDGQAPPHTMAGVLRVPAFRRLITALSLASLGDWLGLLALTALAQNLAADGGYAAANLAVAGVFILRLLPAVVLGALAGVVADRLDRRWTMVIANLLRCVVLAAIPLVPEFWWLFTATFLMESASMFFIPAKEATVPNLVPREQLEEANQVNLLSTYGAAPVAAAIFAGLSLLSGVIDNAVPSFAANPVAIAIYFNAATFLVSGVLIWRIKEIPARSPSVDETASVWRTILDGWAFVGGTPLIRGLVVGMLGAFAAGGAVVGLARTHVQDLGAGDAGYGVLFGAVFLGMAAGMGVGPRLFGEFSRRRLFGLSIAFAGLNLALLALIPNMAIAAALTVTIGAWAGLSWVSGYTIIGLEVEDALRGRTFAFVQTMVRVVLVLVLVLAPLAAAALGRHTLSFNEDVTLSYNGAAITFLLAGLMAAALGVASYRQMDDRRGVPLRADLLAALRHAPLVPAPGRLRGLFLVLEGGEGAGKSTQAVRLAERLRERGHEVVVTREPGATPLGARLRELLLDHASKDISPRAEALLYAADRADHVAAVVRPALERGAVVISDRYVDSSVAYQGAGRSLDPGDVSRVSRWATDGLLPALTVLLDAAPALGLRRSQGPPDRLEAEPASFHERVREEFLALAARAPARYLVVDATRPVEDVTEAVLARLDRLLPPSAREQAEVIERRREEQEARRRHDEERAAERQRAAEARESRLSARTASRTAQRAAKERVTERRGRHEAEAEARRREQERAEEERHAERRREQERDAQTRRAEQGRRAEEERRAQERREEERQAQERREEERQAHERAERERLARLAAQEKERARLAAGHSGAVHPETRASGSTEASLADDLFTLSRGTEPAPAHPDEP